MLTQLGCPHNMLQVPFVYFIHAAYEVPQLHLQVRWTVHLHSTAHSMLTQNGS